MKIMFFMDWLIALDYLEPIYLYLKKQHPNWDLSFAYGDTLSGDILKEKNYPIKDRGEEYDYSICCDKLSNCPKGNRIVVFHGISSKGQEFCVNDREVHSTDISIVASKYYKKLYIEKDGANPDKVIVGGMSKLDTITEIPKPNKIPKILYAPTHNLPLSSMPILGSDIYKINNLKVHLHFYTKHSLEKIHKEFNSLYNKQEEQTDITQLMLESDIVIADLGSVVLEALALGKMVIQVKNPEHLDWYKKKTTTPVDELPEVDIPNRFAFQATSVDEIKEIIKKYPNYKKPDFAIVENIGHYKVSKIIDTIIKEAS